MVDLIIIHVLVVLQNRKDVKTMPQTNKIETFDGAALGCLLNRVYLAGLIEECVLEIANEHGKINAVDMSNSVFLSCSEPIKGMADMKIGLGNLGILCRFFQEEGTYSFSIKEKWIIAKKKGHGYIRVRLLDTAQVPTVVVHKDAKSKILGGCSASFNITQKIAEDLIYYIGLLSTGTVSFNIKDNHVFIHSNKLEEQQFNLSVGVIKADDIKTEVYGQHLVKIVQCLKWEKDIIPNIHLGDGAPVVIQQDEDNLWAITPILE